ncbi:hypothetical protein C8R44DRAFT_745600 [Mycena epipterygia]|nr:hypothetical protein C8R44DRAFT_745600 [Mycena epipterygia]
MHTSCPEPSDVEGSSERVSPVLPDSILDARIPNLRELDLSAINFTWKSLRGLDTLRLSECNDSAPDALQDFTSLLDMLAACPHLKTLRLESLIPPLPARQYPCRKLPMRIAVLNHLGFPPNAKIGICPTLLRTAAEFSRNVAAHSNLSISVYCPPDRVDREASPVTIIAHPHLQRPLRRITVKILKAFPSEFITSTLVPGHGSVPSAVAQTGVPRKRPHCLQLCAGVLNEEREETIVVIFALLKLFLEFSNTNRRRLQVLEIVEEHGSLVQHDDKLQRRSWRNMRKDWWSGVLRRLWKILSTRRHQALR